MESLFEVVGSCGCFQVCHVLCVQLVRMAAVWTLHLMVFGGYAPPWRCLQHATFANTTSTPGSTEVIDHNYSPANVYVNVTKIQLEPNADDYNNISATLSERSRAFLTATDHDDLVNGTTVLSLHPGTCSHMSSCVRVLFDVTSVTVVSDFELICDRGFIPSVIVATQMFGMLFGCSLSGQLGEACGRKINIFTCLAVMSTSTFIAAWSTSWIMLAVLTFFMGVGGGGIISSHFVYTMEFLNPKWRGYVAAIPVGSAFLFVFACVTFGLKNWRHLYMFCAGVSWTILLWAFWAPESLRWLYTHGKEEQSKMVIKKIMTLNKREGDVSEVLKSLNGGEKEEEEEKHTMLNRKYTYLDLFRTKSLCLKTIKVSIVWCSVIMCYVTMSYGIKALSGDFYINLFILSFSEIPFILPMSTLVNKIGRKYTLMMYLFVTAACLSTSLVIFYTTSSAKAGPIIKYLAIMSKGSADVGLTALSIFAVELFPTVVRNLGIGFFNMSARIGTIGSSLLIPRDQGSTIICFFVLVGSLFVGAFLVMSLPETKDKPMADTLNDCEKTGERSRENESNA